jgi:hypothetical protein
VLPLASSMDMAAIPKLIVIHLQWALVSLHMLTSIPIFEALTIQVYIRTWLNTYLSDIAETI